MNDIEKLQEECTHNCMTCGAGCSEHGNGDGVGTLEKTLNAIGDIDGDALLAALQSLAEEDEA